MNGDPDDVSPRPPSIDRLARQIASAGLPHPLAVDVARHLVSAGAVTGLDDELDRVVADAARSRQRQLLVPVINATGTLLHTNLGRAPLAIEHTAAYRNVELDLATGRRGSRHDHCGALIARLVDSATAMVVNNCAAAVMLAVAALGQGASIAVSRGELVEIGGRFRIPDVIEQSGARLIEVGTTNRTRRDDYERAVAQGATAILKVHRSNYSMKGFVESAPVSALADLGVPLIADLGSGLIDERCGWLDSRPSWLDGEPGARQVLASGAHLVTFSGDKLFGGPQAGVIAGRDNLVRSAASHPLARAVRCGTMVLDALQNTLLAYLDGSAGELPFWRMATVEVDTLRRRADRIVALVAERGGSCATVKCESTPGGGTLPDVGIPSVGLAIEGDVVDRLRDSEPPVIARIVDDVTTCDLRTVDGAHDDNLAVAISRVTQG